MHNSLPRAKKEDVNVNWDADKSELNIVGIIYRPGDEEVPKTLALDEQKLGEFDRKGSKANPANVDGDGIAAKIEDGVFLFTIPKTERFVDVKKVDVINVEKDTSSSGKKNGIDTTWVEIHLDPYRNYYGDIVRLVHSVIR